MTDISIVIPTYNRSKLIAEAIESCYTAADGLDIQIVVVDDASTDGSEQIVRSYPVTYVRLESNSGRCVARNTGKERCLGDYVKFLDSDDVLEPGSLRKEYEIARKHDADMVISGWHVTELSEGNVEKMVRTFLPPDIGNHVDCILAGKAVPTSSALYKRGYIKDVVWEAVGPLDDWDFFIHAALQGGKIVSFADPVYRWRQHAGERASGQPMLVTARCFYRILDRLHETLSANGQLSKARRERLAQYYYKELRVLFRFEPEMGMAIEKKIFALDPAFVPRDEERSLILRTIARVLPLHWLLVIYGVGRRALDRLSNAM